MFILYSILTVAEGGRNVIDDVVSS